MDVEWSDKDIKKELANNKQTLENLRTMGICKGADIFSFRSNNTDIPFKNPENIAKYGPRKSEKRV